MTPAERLQQIAYRAASLAEVEDIEQLAREDVPWLLERVEYLERALRACAEAAPWASQFGSAGASFVAEVARKALEGVKAPLPADES